jgi:hypothetical protein
MSQNELTESLRTVFRNNPVGACGWLQFRVETKKSRTNANNFRKKDPSRGFRVSCPLSDPPGRSQGQAIHPVERRQHFRRKRQCFHSFCARTTVILRLGSVLRRLSFLVNFERYIVRDLSFNQHISLQTLLSIEHEFHDGQRREPSRLFSHKNEAVEANFISVHSFLTNCFLPILQHS